jgi:hypothetical protein
VKGFLLGFPLGGSVIFVLSCGKVVKIPSIVRCHPIMSR